MLVDPSWWSYVDCKLDRYSHSVTVVQLISNYPKYVRLLSPYFYNFLSVLFYAVLLVFHYMYFPLDSILRKTKPLCFVVDVEIITKYNWLGDSFQPKKQIIPFFN